MIRTGKRKDRKMKIESPFPTWLIRSIMLLLILTVPAPLAYATTPASRPMLRLATDMHTASLGRIDSDAAGRFVLTCSDDKTAKLWDGASGALLKTFRVYAQEGNEGRLDACALSPDGKTAAVGGWTEGEEKGRGTNIYFLTPPAAPSCSAWPACQT